MATQLRDRLELALSPLVQRLEDKIRNLSLQSVILHYQWQLDLRAHKSDDLPDGFWAKWRYIWSVRLQFPEHGREGSEDEFAAVDALVEEIFDIYSLAAVYDPTNSGRDERAFHFRIGLALKVREVGELFFPEQHRERMRRRFQPFDSAFFIPTFGCTYDEVIAWFDGIAKLLTARLDGILEDFKKIMEEAGGLQDRHRSERLSEDAVREFAKQSNFSVRLTRNAEMMSVAHVFHRDEVGMGLASETLTKLLGIFSIAPPTAPISERVFPHSKTLLAGHFLIRMTATSWFLINPAYALRNFEYTFEEQLLGSPRLRDRYLKNRDRKTEDRIAEVLRKLSPTAEVFQNYYVQRGQHEKDILVLSGRKVLIIECKNSKVRTFEGRSDDALKFQDDFKRSIQSAYEQALEVKRLLLNELSVEFFDEQGRKSISSRREDIDEVFIICIAQNPRGSLGTDLSFSLVKDKAEPYPLALREFDFETICGRMKDLDHFFTYLAARRLLHGRVRSGDELNFAGYFLRYGKLRFADNTMVDDSFSQYFDEAWYEDQGAPQASKFDEEPYEAVFERRRNVVSFRDRKTDRLLDRIVIPPNNPSYSPPAGNDHKGRNRNQPCFCGSGKKFKKCHGLERSA